mgnify:CR=1 FL=1
MKNINFRMKQKMNEVFSIEPNNLGVNFLTIYFKKITAYLKIAPFIYIIPFTILTALILYLFLGRLLVNLVTILQYGY